MGLKIVRKEDPVIVSQLTLCLHGAPGVGKSSMGFTAEKPILLDFDGGAYRSGNRDEYWGFDSWSDVADLTREHFRGFKTAIIDTTGRALDMLTADIISRDPKMGRGGDLNITGWGALARQFRAWMNLIKSYGMDIVHLVHSEEKQQGDSTVERLDVKGSSKNEIYKTSDVMGRISVDEGKRWLNLSPDQRAFGKDPAGMGKVPVPDFSSNPRFLADLIADTKAALSKVTEEQKPARDFLESWDARIKEAITAADFNLLKDESIAAQCSAQVRKMLNKSISEAAKEKGMAWESATKQFAKA
jgi:hypothetical protein